MTDVNQNTSTENFVPDFADYDDTDRDRLSRMPVLKEGLFKTAVTGTARGADEETKNLFIQLTLAPLDVQDKPCTPTARKVIDLPLRNNLVAGHKPVESSDDPKKSVKARFKKFVIAVDPTALAGVQGATKGEDGKYYSVANGQPFTKEDWDTYNKLVNDILLVKAKEWYNNPKALLGAICYTYIKRNEEYANIFWMASNPGSHAVITEGFAG